MSTAEREVGRPRLVSARAVRAHLRWLHEAGVSVRSIGRRAGVEPQTVFRILRGRQHLVSRAAADRLLAVPPSGVEPIRTREGRLDFHKEEVAYPMLCAVLDELPTAGRLRLLEMLALRYIGPQAPSR